MRRFRPEAKAVILDSQVNINEDKFSALGQLTGVGESKDGQPFKCLDLT